MQLTREKEEMISAGIDIGTSTTKLILSRFSLMNTAGVSHVPRIEIIDKEIIHKSPIYRTPLVSRTSIDMEEVLYLVKREYSAAGIEPEDIKTGAVIITGETATKHNAEELIHRLSAEAGDFLVATAGPDLEGIIAAKGSGAFQYSKKTGKTIANIDIGGGTANIAIYQSGNLRGTCTLHIGGRLIEFEDGKIKSISVPIQNLFSYYGWSLEEGQSIQMDTILDVTRAMSRTIAHILTREVEAADEILLFGHKPNWDVEIEEIMFSGGVSECIYRQETEQAVYDDIGTILAKTLRESKELQAWKWVAPEETVRATVLGAGTQTTEISGATIQVEASRLPIKNLPVFHIDWQGDMDNGKSKIQNAILQAIEIYDPEKEGRNFSLYLTGLPRLGFQDVQNLAGWLLEGYRLQPNQQEPIVLVMAHDLAKVIGQTLQMMKPQRDIICIDQILVENGDYLDIGHKLHSEVVPVVVKTLAFHS